MNSMKQKELILIDDDRLILMIHEMELRKLNLSYQTKSFAAGIEALAYLQSQTNEEKEWLILLDINMGDYSGWDFLDDLQKETELRKKVKVIMVSSSIDPDDMKKANDYLEVQNFIIKPLMADFLVNMLKSGKMEDWLV